MMPSELQPSILFWFYKEPELVADRVAFIRRVNPRARIYGLYGGEPAKLSSFTATVAQLDDVWSHPVVDPEWAWDNGDLMITRWHAERGRHLSWEQIVVYQWDLIMTIPVSQLATAGPNEILWTGVRRMNEVLSHWVWVQPWSTRYPAWQKFKLHPVAKGKTIWASVFILATLTRQFLDDYTAIAADIPGFVEYRLPTIAAALGYSFAESEIRPDWGDMGDPLLNGCGRAVTIDQMRDRFREQGGMITCHPVYDLVTDFNLDSGRPSVRPDVVIMQVPPARPGMAPGGSQVVAAAIADGLSGVGVPVALLSGTSSATGDDPVVVAGGVMYVPAFGMTPSLLSDGVPAVQFTAAASDLLSHCSVAIMFDRIYTLPANCSRTLVLGTTAYEFAQQAIISSGWHKMIVPSQFVFDHVAHILRASGQAQRVRDVHIIPNPLDGRRIGLSDLSPVRRGTRSGPIRLLFPHRCDIGKGINLCLHFLAALAVDHNIVMTVIADQSSTAEEGVYASVIEKAARLGVRDKVEFSPWRPMRQMAELYTSADLTLCLGDVAEGFGLVCLESILCGTPVLAKDVGAQTRILPPGHGCIVASSKDGNLLTSDVNLAIELLRDPSLPVQIGRGQDFIRERFALGPFLDAVREVIGIGR